MVQYYAQYTEVRHWCHLIEERWTNIHDDGHSDQPNVLIDTLVEKWVRKLVRLIGSQFLSFHCTLLSSHLFVHKIVLKKLTCMKWCVTWVPRMLSDIHKQQHVGADKKCLQCFENIDGFFHLLDKWSTDYLGICWIKIKHWTVPFIIKSQKNYTRTFCKKNNGCGFWDHRVMVLRKYFKHIVTINID